MFGQDELFPEGGAPAFPTDLSRIPKVLSFRPSVESTALYLSEGSEGATPPMLVASGRGYMMLDPQYFEVIANQLASFWVIDRGSYTDDPSVGGDSTWMQVAQGAPPTASAPQSAAQVVRQLRQAKVDGQMAGYGLILAVDPTGDVQEPLRYKLVVTSSEELAMREVAGTQAAMSFLDARALTAVPQPFRMAPFVMLEGWSYPGGEQPEPIGPTPEVSPEMEKLAWGLGIGAVALAGVIGGGIYFLSRRKKKKAMK